MRWYLTRTSNDGARSLHSDIQSRHAIEYHFPLLCRTIDRRRDFFGPVRVSLSVSSSPCSLYTSSSKTFVWGRRAKTAKLCFSLYARTPMFSGRRRRAGKAEEERDKDEMECPSFPGLSILFPTTKTILRSSRAVAQTVGRLGHTFYNDCQSFIDCALNFFCLTPLFPQSLNLSQAISNTASLLLQVDLRHIDEDLGRPEVEIGVDLTEFYMSVEWDILEVPAIRNVKYVRHFSETYHPFPDYISHLRVVSCVASDILIYSTVNGTDIRFSRIFLPKCKHCMPGMRQTLTWHSCLHTSQPAVSMTQFRHTQLL